MTDNCSCLPSGMCFNCTMQPAPLKPYRVTLWRRVYEEKTLHVLATSEAALEQALAQLHTVDEGDGWEIADSRDIEEADHEWFPDEPGEQPMWIIDANGQLHEPKQA